MFNLGWPEVAIVLFLAVLIFGPKKLPELGSSFGKTLKEFTAGMTGKSEDDRNDEM